MTAPRQQLSNYYILLLTDTNLSNYHDLHSNTTSPWIWMIDSYIIIQPTASAALRAIVEVAFIQLSLPS